ncbi:DNA alkylation repair protein [Streptomyces sp. NPDC058691]|uniref:DNA alkylation repair protein n=1 Tax=Streptomyces sp. NPDC058691 TaxID=3346601 RepID=UPI00365697F4
MPLAEELLGHAAAAGLGVCMERANGPRGAAAVRSGAARLDGLALRERSDLLRDALLTDLPDDYPRVEAVVRTALKDPEFTGWMIWPVTEAVVSRALEATESDAFESSLELLADLTPRLTAEFAIRRVLVADLERALKIVERWVHHPDEHVRRLATEGTRPRLPWAIRVPGILARPRATLPILDALYRDPSEYVRRSVANHVNDISHADPDLAVDVVTRWAAAPDDHTPRLIRHALRTAVKKGHPGALALLGFEPAAGVTLTGLELTAARVTVGEELAFTFQLENTGDAPAKLAIDYVIHYQKANGRTAPKVFKLTTRTLGAGERLSISRRHSFKRISTRVFHPGSHALELQINGVAQGKAGFDLVVPAP